MKASVLVLGGGFAGLSAAIHLALEGREVTLLEQAATLGGKAGEYREVGYRFDTGPSVWTSAAYHHRNLSRGPVRHPPSSSL